MNHLFISARLISYKTKSERSPQCIYLAFHISMLVRCSFVLGEALLDTDRVVKATKEVFPQLRMLTFRIDFVDHELGG